MEENIIMLNRIRMRSIPPSTILSLIDRYMLNITSSIINRIKISPDNALKIVHNCTYFGLLYFKIQNVILAFQNLLSKLQKLTFLIENKILLINQIKSISILLLSQYLQDTLFTPKDKVRDDAEILKRDRNEAIEKALFELFQELYPEIFRNINSFIQIKLQDLMFIWQTYFINNQVQEIGDGGGLIMALPYIFDIFKGKDLTIDQFIEQTKAIFENFYYINLSNKDGKEQLKKIKEESEKLENKDKPFIVYTYFSDHAVVSIIQNGEISIIDSSHVILNERYPKYRKILNGCGFEDGDMSYFNEIPYQENGTCYLNAALAFKYLAKELEKDKATFDVSNLRNGIGVKVKYGSNAEIEFPQFIIDMVLETKEFYLRLQQSPINEQHFLGLWTSEEPKSMVSTTTTTTTIIAEERFTESSKVPLLSAIDKTNTLSAIGKTNTNNTLIINKEQLTITLDIIAIAIRIISQLTENKQRISDDLAKILEPTLYTTILTKVQAINIERPTAPVTGRTA